MARNRAILWALLLIGIGVFLLLRNAGVIPQDVEGWPLLIVAIGVWLLLEHLWFRSGGFVWPLVLIVVGAALFLQNIDALRNEDVVLPIVVIAVGVGLLLSVVLGRGASDGESASVPLEGASEAAVRIDHGAGRLRVTSMLGGEHLLEGRFVGGVRTRVNRTGDRLDVALRSAPGAWSRGAGRGEGLAWDVSINRQVPVSLDLNTGASDSDLDLADLRLSELALSTGASRTVLNLPASGQYRIRIEGGAANLRVRVPTNVAASIESRSGLASVDVDERRFPRTEGGWRSPDYETAERRAEIRLGVAGASVQIG
jgi:LiaF transmembrane domain